MVKQTKKNRKSRIMRKSRKVRKSRKLRKSKTMQKSRKLRKSKSMRKSRYRTHREGGGWFTSKYSPTQQMMLGLIKKENENLDEIIKENDKILMRTKPEFKGIISRADKRIMRASAYKEILKNVKYYIKNNINLLMPDVNVVNEKNYEKVYLNRLADVNIVFMEVLTIEEIYCILNVKPEKYLSEYTNLEPDNRCKQSENVDKIYESLFIKVPSSGFVDLSQKKSPTMNVMEEGEEGNDDGPDAAADDAAADDYMEVGDGVVDEVDDGDADGDDAADGDAGYIKVESN